MVGFKSAAVMLAATSVAVMTLAVPSQAESLTKDLYRARVVDFCLYDRWEKAKNGETKHILGDCKCAAKKFVDDLNEKDLASALKSGSVGWSQKRTVLSNYEACSK
nr:hypothetical protein [uncultured Cohaesibacter sp.]